VRAALGVALLLGRLAWAADDPATASLDRLVTMQRPAGGWSFWSPPGGRPHAYTLVVRQAERIASPFGLATWDLVVVRSPGTPAAGLALLEGYARTGRAAYRDAAIRAGELVLATQLAPGGWFSEVPLHGRVMPWWFRWPAAYRPMLDDDVTPGAIRFLLGLWTTTGEPRFRDAAERGIALVLRAEIPTGGWPLDARPAWLREIHPAFEDRPALNDGATPLVMTTLIDAAVVLDRPELLAAARRGGDWLLTRLPPDGPAGWAQQYTPDGAPAPARAFEVPALATWETRHAVEALERLARATGARRYCDAARRAAGWLARVRIAPRCWARFLDPQTGAPIFVDGAGRRVATVAEARPGYDWVGDFGIPAVLARLGMAPGPVAYRLPGDPGRCADDTSPPPSPDDPRAIIAAAGSALAASGAWPGEVRVSPCEAARR
jgi:hypothetical protein